MKFAIDRINRQEEIGEKRGTCQLTAQKILIVLPDLVAGVDAMRILKLSTANVCLAKNNVNKD